MLHTLTDADKLKHECLLNCVSTSLSFGILSAHLIPIVESFKKQVNDMPLMTRPVAVAPTWAKIKEANVAPSHTNEIATGSLNQETGEVKEGESSRMSSGSSFSDWSRNYIGSSDGAFSDGNFGDRSIRSGISGSGSSSYSSTSSLNRNDNNNPFQKSLALVHDAAADANTPLDVRLGRPVPLIEPPSVTALRNVHGNAAAPNRVWATKVRTRTNSGNNYGGASSSKSIGHKEQHNVHGKSSGYSGNGALISHSSSNSDVDTTESASLRESRTSDAKETTNKAYVTTSSSSGTLPASSTSTSELPGAHRGYEHNRCSRRACTSTRLVMLPLLYMIIYSASSSSGFT